VWVKCLSDKYCTAGVVFCACKTITRAGGWTGLLRLPVILNRSTLFVRALAHNYLRIWHLGVFAAMHALPSVRVHCFHCLDSTAAGRFVFCLVAGKALVRLALLVVIFMDPLYYELL
jgi:hypothetical protein